MPAMSGGVGGGNGRRRCVGERELVGHHSLGSLQSQKGRWIDMGVNWTGLHALIAGFAAAAAGPEEAGIEELLERLRMGIRKKTRVRAH